LRASGLPPLSMEMMESMMLSRSAIAARYYCLACSTAPSAVPNSP
jgi:hypothetical protein